MASSNATHIIVTKIIDDVTDEDDNDLLFATKDIGSHQTSNMEVDVAWVLFASQLMANWKFWYPFHHVSSYWGLFVVNDGEKINSCNPQTM
jgi:hypothetical protein